MKITVKRKKIELKFDQTIKPEFKERIKNTVRCWKKKAKSGVPYAVLNLLHELDKNSILDITVSDDIKCAGLAVNIMIERFGWYKIGHCYYGLDGNASLRDMIDGCTGSGFSFSIAGKGKGIGRFASPSQTNNNILKAVSRLVDDGRFMRVERGRYKRIHVGM